MPVHIVAYSKVMIERETSVSSTFRQEGRREKGEGEGNKGCLNAPILVNSLGVDFCKDREQERCFSRRECQQTCHNFQTVLA